MTDSRAGTPISASPSQRSSLHRSVFPWASPSPLRVVHRNSQSSMQSGPTSSTSAWDQRTAASFANSLAWPGSMSSQSTGNNAQAYQDDNTRQWTFMGFEWVVRDVARLRDFVEALNSPQETGNGTLQQDEFEILRHSPIISNRFKLEVAPVPTVNEGDIAEADAAARESKLSLYLTSLMMEMEVAHEMPTTLMAAIKSPRERGARPDWVWERWTDWIFRQESEVWECPLPSISSLLENRSISESDSFIICLQIHAPVGPLYPQQPDAYYVPKDLLDGIETSLDNSNTGDVQFICLEKFPADGLNSPVLDDPNNRRSPSSSSSLPSSRHSARKRIIYAHSDILTRRSDYFATMLNSSFAERATSNNPGDRKVWRIVVEETDFQTMYWVLKYLYASYCVFKDHDDPRAAVEGVGTGWSAKWLHSRGGEWDWKPLPRSAASDDHHDAGSIASADSVVSNDNVPHAVAPSEPAFHSPSRTSVPRGNALSSKSSTAPSGSRPSNATTSIRKPNAGGGEPSSNVTQPAVAQREGKAPALPLSIPSAKFSTPHYPLSPRSQRNPTSLSTPDPHPHPTPTPQPASALAIYQVAHRYGMPKLASLALEHIMATISPETSLALLLATAIWDELRILVEEYVVERWDDVSHSAEFEQCLEEISAGEWGTEGGKTLTRLFRRLRSPVR